MSTTVDKKLNICGSKKGYWFFKENKCWFKKYGKGNLLDGPKEISDTFAGLPNNLDAAVFNGSTYNFFKGRQYWRKKYGEKVEGPYPISDWGFEDKEVGCGLDAVCYQKKSKKYYFFKGNKYWNKKLGSDKKVKDKGLIKDGWTNIPEKLKNEIDGVCVRQDTGAYWFFKDSLCWKKPFGKDKYEERNIDEAWPSNSSILLKFKLPEYKVESDPTFKPPII